MKSVLATITTLAALTVAVPTNMAEMAEGKVNTTKTEMAEHGDQESTMQRVNMTKPAGREADASMAQSTEEAARMASIAARSSTADEIDMASAAAPKPVNATRMEDVDASTPEHRNHAAAAAAAVSSSSSGSASATDLTAMAARAAAHNDRTVDQLMADGIDATGLRALMARINETLTRSHEVMSDGSSDGGVVERDTEASNRNNSNNNNDNNSSNNNKTSEEMAALSATVQLMRMANATSVADELEEKMANATATIAARDRAMEETAEREVDMIQRMNKTMTA